MKPAIQIQHRHLSFDSAIVKFWTTMSNSTPVAYMQHGLVQIHDFTGLPWWASIILSTFLFRTIITLPLAIYQNKIAARLENLALEMPAIVAELKKETALAVRKYHWDEHQGRRTYNRSNKIAARLENLALEMPAIVAELKKETALAVRKYHWDEHQARRTYNRSLKKQWNKLIVRDNCHPAKTLIVLWGQIPLWIFQSVAIRNLVYMLPDPNILEAKLIFTELTIGGFGWIPNLTEVDSSYILPVALGLINLGIIQIQATLRTRPQTRLQRYLTNAFRLLSVGMIPIASTVPSALCLYWVSSSLYGVMQNLILISPGVKRLAGVPQTKSEMENPYEHLMIAFKKRFGFNESSSKNGPR